MPNFLADRDPRTLNVDAPGGFQPMGLFLGEGSGVVLEVAVLNATRRPTAPELRTLHQARLGRRATPVVIAVLWGDDRSSICGPSGDSVGLRLDLPRQQTERICEAALGMPDRHAATRFLSQSLGQLETSIPGLRNSGLFALHELEAGVPNRQDWGPARTRSQALLSRRGRELIEGLGFQIQSLPGPELVLVARGTKVALALLLERVDEIEPASPRFGNISPISHALAKADQENLDFVVISAGSTLRVYPVRTGVGTGRRGRTETYTEVNLDLLSPEQAGYIWLLYSADALSGGGPLPTYWAGAQTMLPISDLAFVSGCIRKSCRGWQRLWLKHNDCTILQQTSCA